MLRRKKEMTPCTVEVSHTFESLHAHVRFNNGAVVHPGDEVIVPNLTFIATSNAVLMTGATPVFCEVSPATLCIDPEEIAKLINKNTKAVMPVHLYGQSADMHRIMEIAKKHNLLTEPELSLVGDRITTKEKLRKLVGESFSNNNIKELGLKQKAPIREYIKRPGVSLFDTLIKTGKIKNLNWPHNHRENEAIEDVETEIKYSGYIKRHLKEIEKTSQNEELLINKDLDYLSISGLSSEAKEKLSAVKPQTLGQASRVSGVSPADVSVLMLHLNKP